MISLDSLFYLLAILSGIMEIYKSRVTVKNEVKYFHLDNHLLMYIRKYWRIL
jgi:hypothetical protein